MIDNDAFAQYPSATDSGGGSPPDLDRPASSVLITCAARPTAYP